MKTVKLHLFLVLLLLGITTMVNGQGSNEWRVILNNDHSAFQIKIINHEMTFYFNHLNDTLSFFQGNKKSIKSGVAVEIVLKNSNKVVYTSSDKNFNSGKTEIIIPLADVSDALKNIKLPSKPKYVISIKDRTVVKESLNFEFTEK